MVLKIGFFYDDDHGVMDDLSNEPWQAYSDSNARKGAMDGRKEARSMWVIYYNRRKKDSRQSGSKIAGSLFCIGCPAPPLGSPG